MSSGHSQVAESTVATRPARLHYIDWLRVLAMLSIFLFHNMRFFDFYPWHVNNPETSLGSSIFVSFFNQWMMPLFFILSGASVYYALRFRTAGGFIKERSLRILIPWILIGIFVIAPPQVYLERLSHGEFSGSFFQFYYPDYFDGIYGFGGNLAIIPMHLWYLVLLFLFSLIALPLLLPGKKEGKSLISRMATSFQKPWALLLLFIPLGAVAILADVAGLDWTRQMGSWDILSYLLFFIYGYLIFSNTQIQAAIGRYRTAALIAALVLAVTGLYIQYGIALTYNVPIWIGSRTFDGLRAWCWIIAILGFGSRYLNFNNRFLGYGNEAVLPFYILHQTIILIIGFFVVQWSMGIAPKYFIIASTSFVAIMVIYELLVRRINILRFLFGMRLKGNHLFF